MSKLKREDDKTAEGLLPGSNFCKFLKRDSIDINQINKAMLLEYKDWFEREGFGNRAWEMYMSGSLKRCITTPNCSITTRMMRNLNIKLSPFKTIQFRRSAVEKRDVEPMALSATALRYLWDVPMERLTPRGKMARDAFFLSFSLCGMNAVDMWKHKQARGLQGRLYRILPSKTDVPAREPSRAYILNKYMKEVHERNRGKRHTWFYAELYSTSNNFNAALSYGLADLVNNAVHLLRAAMESSTQVQSASRYSNASNCRRRRTLSFMPPVIHSPPSPVTTAMFRPRRLTVAYAM